VALEIELLGSHVQKWPGDVKKLNKQTYVTQGSNIIPLVWSALSKYIIVKYVIDINSCLTF